MSKEHAKIIQDFLKEKGYTCRGDKEYSPKIGDAYELMARLSGYKSWNVASANPVEIQEAMQNLAETSDVPGKGSKEFEFKLKAELEGRCYFKVKAESGVEALNLLEKYLEGEEAYGILTDNDTWEIASTLEVGIPRVTSISSQGIWVNDEHGLKPKAIQKSEEELIRRQAILEKVKDFNDEEVSLVSIVGFVTGKYKCTMDEAANLIWSLVTNDKKLKVCRKDKHIYFSLGKMSEIEIDDIRMGRF